MSQQLAKQLEQEELAAVAAMEEREALEALRDAGVNVDGPDEHTETDEQRIAREAEEAEAIRAAAEAEAALGIAGSASRSTEFGECWRSGAAERRAASCALGAEFLVLTFRIPQSAQSTPGRCPQPSPLLIWCCIGVCRRCRHGPGPEVAG